MAIIKTEQIGIRVTPEQKAILEEAAQAAGCRLAEWVRLVALQEARDQRPARV